MQIDLIWYMNKDKSAIQTEKREGPAHEQALRM